MDSIPYRDRVSKEWAPGVVDPARFELLLGGLQECMKCMGGVGYLESKDMQFNIARLYRDANVITIWEGTTDMMSDDVRRVVFGKMSQQVRRMGRYRSEGCNPGGQSHAEWIKTSSKLWQTTIHTYRPEEIQLNARDITIKLGDVVMAALTILDASRDGDRLAIDYVNAWFEFRDPTSASETRTFEEIAAGDRRLVFGENGPEAPRARL